MSRYVNVLLTFARNSLVRDLSFRTDFVLQFVSSLAWTLMNLLFFKILFTHVESIGRDTGWTEHEAFAFLATVWIVNGVVQTLFMPNAEGFSELVRTGNLDFALLKPIDTQFLVSFPRFNWPSLANFLAGVGLLAYSIWQLTRDPVEPLQLSLWSVGAYIVFVGCGVAIMYALTMALASTSVWLGRNQNIYLFWFYLTQFYRYPMEIYQRGVLGWSLWGALTFAVPVLVVANVPARLLAQPLRPDVHPQTFWLAGFTVLAAAASLVFCRWVFQQALVSYRSASS